MIRARMRSSLFSLAGLCGVGLLAGPALAEEPVGPGDKAPAEAAAEPEAGVDAAAGTELAAPEIDPLVMALQLPAIAHSARLDGVEDTEVKDAIVACQKAKLDPAAAAEALAQATVKMRADAETEGEEAQAGPPRKGPPRKGPPRAGRGYFLAKKGVFGGFVKEQVESGKTGKDLAKAIHEEHGKKGIGAGQHDTAGHWRPAGRPGRPGGPMGPGAVRPVPGGADGGDPPGPKGPGAVRPAEPAGDPPRAGRPAPAPGMGPGTVHKPGPKKPGGKGGAPQGDGQRDRKSDSNGG